MDTYSKPRKDAGVLNFSVAKAFAILEYLAAVDSPKELGVISAALDMNKSTVYRFLFTMGTLGYIKQDPQTGRYALGPRLVWLGSRFLDSLDFRGVARPYLEKLVAETRETVHLAILHDLDVVYVDKVDGMQPVKMASQIGGRMPAHSTGLGKALLAFLDRDQWPVYIQKMGLTKFTPQTIDSPEAFYAHLQEIRERGYAIDNCENEEGIRCVAVPIRNHRGKTIAALSISGWSLTMIPERDETLAVMAREASQQISERLGSLVNTRGEVR